MAEGACSKEMPKTESIFPREGTNDEPDWNEAALLGTRLLRTLVLHDNRRDSA
jgi:hypothetical protein